MTTLIRTTGLSKVQALPDIAEPVFTVQVSAPTPEKATRAARAAQEAVNEALSGAAVIDLSDPEPWLMPKSNPVSRPEYLKSLAYTVRVVDVLDVERCLEALLRLPEVRLYGVLWATSQGEVCERQAQEEALAQARKVADRYAAAMQTSVVGVESITDRSPVEQRHVASDGSLGMFAKYGGQYLSDVLGYTLAFERVVEAEFVTGS